jgi:hypothetical protein
MEHLVLPFTPAANGPDFYPRFAALSPDPLDILPPSHAPKYMGHFCPSARKIGHKCPNRNFHPKWLVWL